MLKVETVFFLRFVKEFRKIFSMSQDRLCGEATRSGFGGVASWMVRSQEITMVRNTNIVIQVDGHSHMKCKLGSAKEKMLFPNHTGKVPIFSGH